MLVEDPASASRSKKRARDRRAQKNMRDKRQAHIKSLEHRIDHLQNELGVVQKTCHQLRIENEMLRGCRCRANHFSVASSSLTHQSPSTRHPPAKDSCSKSSCAKSSLPYNLTPFRSEQDIQFVGTPPTWSQRPDLAQACSDSPSAVELLYGSKTNFLANTLHANFRQWPCRDPERLAASSLTYHAIKWMLSPSEERYQALHEFQRPLPEQVNTMHHFFIDFVMWPALRTNLICHQDTYEVEDVIGMLVCCIKLRWPWNEAVFEPEEDGRLRMKPRFIETFSKLENWTLTKEFWNRYPKLVEGMDRGTFLCDFLWLY